MIKDKTGVQLNAAHTATDDFITKKYILPLLQDEETRNRLIAEHKATPVGRAPHKGNPVVEHSPGCTISGLVEPRKGWIRKDVNAHVPSPPS